ncbi:MAG: hypothetical protein IKL82_05820 [Clostridia bacterium]|nr:hypothetical protein [Clostridia bacterium]
MNTYLQPEIITIRIPSFLLRQIRAEVKKLKFYKNNGNLNVNKFLTKMIPSMIEFTNHKSESLKTHLYKNIKDCLPEKMQDKIIDFIMESVEQDLHSKQYYSCEEVITLRLDVKNEDFYAKLFTKLDDIGVKKSTFLRNIIVEYFKQSEYQRQRICFYEECKKIKDIANDERLCCLKIRHSVINVIPLGIEYSAKDSYLYLIYFKEKDYSKIFSVPLCMIDKALPLRKVKYTLTEEFENCIANTLEEDNLNALTEFDLN